MPPSPEFQVSPAAVHRRAPRMHAHAAIRTPLTLAPPALHYYNATECYRVHAIRVRLGPERATHLSLVTPRGAAARLAPRAATYVVVSQLQSNVTKPLHVHHSKFRKAMHAVKCRPVQASEQLVRQLKAVGAVARRGAGAELISFSSAMLVLRHLALPSGVANSVAEKHAASVVLVEPHTAAGAGPSSSSAPPPPPAAAAAVLVLPEEIPSTSYATPEQLGRHHYGLNSIKSKHAKAQAKARVLVDLQEHKRCERASA
jgi:hypothetical protein